MQLQHRLACTVTHRRVSTVMIMDWLQSLQGSPLRAHCTHTSSAIMSDPYPARTGRVAAHGGRNGRTGRTEQK